MCFVPLRIPCICGPFWILRLLYWIEGKIEQQLWWTTTSINAGPIYIVDMQLITHETDSFSRGLEIQPSELPLFFSRLFWR